MSQNKHDVTRAMGEWLSGLAKWNVYVTWTFSRLVSEAGVHYWVNRGLDDWQRYAKTKLFAYVASECGPVGGLWHAHGLVGNVESLIAWCGVRRGAAFRPHLEITAKSRHGASRGYEPAAEHFDCCLVHSWTVGYARVFPYDPARGAADYVAKYVTKELGDWRLIGFPVAEPEQVRA